MRRVDILRQRLGHWLLLVAVLFAPALGWASDGEGAGGGGNPMTEFKPGLLIWTVLTFVLLVGLLRWKAWPPIVAALKTREDAVRHAIAEARKGREEAEKILEEQRKVLGEARKQALDIAEQARLSAERLRVELVAKARAEAERAIADGRQAIETEKYAAIQEIRTTAVDLALGAAAKIIELKLDDAGQRTLVKNFVDEVGRTN